MSLNADRHCRDGLHPRRKKTKKPDVTNEQLTAGIHVVQNRTKRYALKGETEIEAAKSISLNRHERQDIGNRANAVLAAAIEILVAHKELVHRNGKYCRNYGQ